MHLSLSLVQYLHYMTGYMPIINSDALLGTITNLVRHCEKRKKERIEMIIQEYACYPHALNLYKWELCFNK